MSVNGVNADIAEEFSKLSLEDSTVCEGDASPMSPCKGFVKKVRHEDCSLTVPHLFRSDITLLNPLLYLRVGRNISDSRLVAHSSETESKSIPTLEEIIAANSERDRLLTGFGPPANAPNRKQKQLAENSSAECLKETKRINSKLPVAVFRFCQANAVKYLTINLKRSYRSIAFSYGRGKGPAPAGFDPWQSFITDNHLDHYRLCHSVYFKWRDPLSGEEGRLVCLVAHSRSKLNTSALSERLSLEVTRMSLTSVEKELGFPTFMCPPFGFEFAPKMHQGAAPADVRTLIDAALTVEASTDCIFELGMVALRIRPAELNRLARKLKWTVVPDLANLVS